MFPQTPPNARAARLTTFQVLVEDELGCLSFLETKARTPPEPASTLAVLAAHGWSARRPWQLPSRGAGAPLLQMHADVEAPASWPLEASVRDALGAALAVRMPAQASDAAALRDTLRMDMSTGLALAVEEFVGRLDAGIVRLARAAGGLSVARYNYLAGGDPLTRRNRLQAVGRHPALLDSLAADAGYESVRNAIDAGEPLLDRLSLHFGVPKSVVRRVADTPLAWIGARWRARPHLLMRLLADIEPSNRPANQEQWGRFDRAVELVTRATGHPATSTGNRLWIRRSASEGFRRTPAPDANLAGIAAVLDAFCAGVQEALREDLRDLAGAAQAELLARHALARLQQGLGVERLASLAAKWLAAWRVEQAGAEAELRLAAGERWPSLLPDGLQVDALRVAALCTPGALREEAARMGHCVDTYAGACARGECQIFSIRSEGDLPLSTIETKVARTPGGVFSVAIVQHAGALNAKPPDRCIRVAGALVDALSRARAELEAYWRWRTNVARLLRGDRIAVARAAAARRALERVLPKRLGYDVLLQAAIARASPPGGAGGSPA